MLLKQLSKKDRHIFLCTAQLLTLADQPLLWEGEPRSRTSTNTRFTNITIARNSARQAAIDELFSALDATERLSIMVDRAIQGPQPGAIAAKLISEFRLIPAKDENDAALRLKVANQILGQVMKTDKEALPSVPKLMLFELMLLALADGAISSVQWQLLVEFRHQYGLEDYIFSDLLTRARCTHIETQKTLAIILE
jgi:hypothetical protein